jgi:hypothetical protein
MNDQYIVDVNKIFDNIRDNFDPCMAVLEKKEITSRHMTNLKTARKIVRSNKFQDFIIRYLR